MLGAGVRDRGRLGSVRVFVGLGRIEWADMYCPRYSIFMKLIKNRIHCRYVSHVSAAYPYPI